MRNAHQSGLRWTLSAAAVAATLALSACSSAASTGTTTSQAPTGGGQGASITIGVAAITLASPVVPLQIDTIQTAAKALGWNVKVLNANGNPSQEAADMMALVNQGVNAIIDIAEQPAQVQQGMQAAQAKGIPIIAVGAPLLDPTHFAATTYAPSDAKMADLLASQMLSDYTTPAKALSLNASEILAIAIRKNELLAKTKGTGISVAANHETDLANAVQDTQQAVSDTLRANPDISVIWGLQDFEFSTSLQVLTQMGLTKQVGVFSFYLDPVDFGLLRAAKTTGQKLAVVDSPIQYCPWYAMDALVNKFILKKSDWITSMSIEPLPYALVTPQNVQASGTTYQYAPFQPFFLNRWKAAGVKLSTSS